MRGPVPVRFTSRSPPSVETEGARRGFAKMVEIELRQTKALIVRPLISALIMVMAMTACRTRHEIFVKVRLDNDGRPVEVYSYYFEGKNEIFDGERFEWDYRNKTIMHQRFKDGEIDSFENTELPSWTQSRNN